MTARIRRSLTGTAGRAAKRPFQIDARLGAPNAGLTRSPQLRTARSAQDDVGNSSKLTPRDNGRADPPAAAVPTAAR